MQKPLIPVQAVLYILGTLIGAVIGFALLWYVLSQVFSAFASVGHTLFITTSSNTTTTDQIETFLANVVGYMAVIGLIVFGIAAWQYSQRKGVVVGE